MEPSHFPNIRRLNLIATPTPVHRLTGYSRLFVKREDMTDWEYGGNKVRNLEFLLADAVQKNARKIVTVAPLGSNFIAALSVQTERLGIPTGVFHFQPAMNELIAAQASFSAKHGTYLRLFRGQYHLAAARAQLALMRETFANHSYAIAAGGSSPLGVLGHINAVFELHQQVKNGEIPEPEVIVVGAGTCGTIAGLLAGLRLTGMKTRVIGVRCVDPIVCNPFHIASLSNGALRLLKSRIRISYRDVDLRDEGILKYGKALAGGEDLIAEVKATSGITLDTTYTSKVFSFLRREMMRGSFKDQNVLYWHTFSPGAFRKSGPRISHEDHLARTADGSF